jgi:hypothetical protein
VAECRRAAEEQAQRGGWRRYLACDTLPLPACCPPVARLLPACCLPAWCVAAGSRMTQRPPPPPCLPLHPTGAHVHAQGQLALARSCDGEVTAAVQAGRGELAQALLGDMEALRAHISARVDSATAAMLQVGGCSVEPKRCLSAAGLAPARNPAPG